MMMFFSRGIRLERLGATRGGPLMMSVSAVGQQAKNRRFFCSSEHSSNGTLTLMSELDFKTRGGGLGRTFFVKSRRFTVEGITQLKTTRQAIADNVEKGNVSEAEEALNQLTQTTGESDLELYMDVFDAWIRRQQEVENVHERFEAADRAHALLEKIQHMSPDHRNTTPDYGAVIYAWLNVSRTMLQTETPLRGIPQRAQQALEQMQSSAKLLPTIGVYNAVIETWGNSAEHLRASMAENVFEKLINVKVSPTNETYLTLIRAWCRSKQDRAAFNATGHLMKLHRIMEQDDKIKPTVEDYHTILEAWTRAGDKLAPQKSFSVIKLIQTAYTDRVIDFRPDETCYRYVLSTYARSTLPNLGEDVDELMNQMANRLLAIDSECYTYAIRAWKNSATHWQCETQHNDAIHANRLLHKMEQAHRLGMDVHVKPTTENYNDVIQAWSASTLSGAAVYAEALLKMLEVAYEAGNASLKPDSSSYRWALEAWANSLSKDKLNQAVAILSRMKDATEGSDDDHAKPTVDVFNAFIRVCGTSTHGNGRDKKFNLKLAVETVDEMRKRGESPNSKTFCLLLEACQNLLPHGNQQSRAVEKVFRNCCDHGLVDDKVLAQFQAVAPSEVYGNLVVANSTEEKTEGSKSGKVVPKEWTRNVGIKVTTMDGEQSKPLNIDAMFVMTKRIKDFRVERFRKHTNQKLLRGGRKRYVKNSVADNHK